MAKMISDFQKGEIARLTRLANRRIERAEGGQRSYLEHWVNQMTGAKQFSAATKGLTFMEAQAKLKDLYAFTSSYAGTKKGWERLRQVSLEKANEKLGDMGYDITNEELGDILEQLPSGSSREDFYRAVNLVDATKEDEGDDFESTAENIADIMAEKVTYQDAYEMAKRAREKRAARKMEGKRNKRK